MRFGFNLALGLILLQGFAGGAFAADLDAYQCHLTLKREDINIRSSAYYMVLDSGLGSDFDAPAVGELADGLINFRYGVGNIVARIHVRDTFELPNRYNVTLTIIEINGLGEERELSSARFRRGDQNLESIFTSASNEGLKVECNYLKLGKI